MRLSLVVLAAMLATIPAPPPAAASYPATVRARPLRVLPLPENALGQAMVRIGGVFALYDFDLKQPLAPRCGSIDFFCRGDVALCRQEWDDFMVAAAAGRCVAASLLLWSPVDQAVEPFTTTVHNPNPYDPIMGVADIPCRPEPASAERPDLTIACDLGPSCDAGATDPTATDKPVNVPDTPARPAPPPASADAAVPSAVPVRRFGCAVGGAGGAWPAAAALFVLALRRRRRT
jgi:MYXO-CTERM domain-containing protein